MSSQISSEHYPASPAGLILKNSLPKEICENYESSPVTCHYFTGLMGPLISLSSFLTTVAISSDNTVVLDRKCND